MRWRELALNLLGGRVGTVTVTEAGCYIKALEIDPNYATAWISLGFIGGGRVGTVTFTEAGCYIKALEIDPNYATAWISLGFIGGGRVGTVTRSLNHANLARGIVVLRGTQLRMPLLSRHSV